MPSISERKKLGAFRPWFAVLIFWAGLRLVVPCHAAEQKRFDFLETKLMTYSNVLVTDVTPEQIFIRHNQGIAAIKVSSLNPEVRQILGLGLESKPASSPVEEKKRVETGKHSAEPALAKNAERKSGSEVLNLRNSWQAFRSGFITSTFGALDAPPERGTREQTMRRVAWSGISALLLYIFYCKVLWRLCDKSTGSGSMLVLLPGLRWIPMLRAAGMSTQWFLLWLTFIVSVVCPPPMSGPTAFFIYLCFVATLCAASIALYCVWCFKICTELNRTAWLGLLVLCPLTYLIALSYLSWAGRNEKEACSAPRVPQLA